MSIRDVPVERWRRSSRSSAQGGQCVEVADAGRGVAVRDSKDPEGPALVFAGADWREFTRRIKGSGHDLP